jgi:hypothetical protein
MFLLGRTKRLEFHRRSAKVVRAEEGTTFTCQVDRQDAAQQTLIVNLGVVLEHL